MLYCSYCSYCSKTQKRKRMPLTVTAQEDHGDQPPMIDHAKAEARVRQFRKVAFLHALQASQPEAPVEEWQAFVDQPRTADQGNAHERLMRAHMTALPLVEVHAAIAPHSVIPEAAHDELKRPA